MIRGLVLFLGLVAGAAGAVEPGEMLPDPAQEARAQELGREIRCLVCRSESIEASNADFARDLRLVVRERISAGDSDQEVRRFLTDRFGDYVLLRPRFGGSTLALWLLGPILLLAGGVAAFAFIRRSRPVAVAALSQQEEERLERLLENRGAQK